MIVDTTFLIDLMQKNEDAMKKEEILRMNGEVPAVSIVSIFELHSGLVRSQRPEEERNKVKNVLESQVVISLERATVEIAGELHGKLIKEGKMLEAFDCLIGATALLRNETLLSRNVKDFQKIQGLKIESY